MLHGGTGIGAGLGGAGFGRTGDGGVLAETIAVIDTINNIVAKIFFMISSFTCGKRTERCTGVLGSVSVLAVPVRAEAALGPGC
jgi:hypothetical protein